MYASTDGTLGLQAMNDVFTPDLTQRHVLGQLATGVDPYFGFGEFVYGKAFAAMGPGRLVFQDNAFLMTDLPNTANMGRPVAVARANFAQNAFGWFQIGGMCPIQTVASIAVGVAIGIGGAAGQANANAAGKQLLNAYCAQPSTFAVNKNCSTQNGSPVVQVGNLDGLFVGLTASGTGMSGVIQSLNPNGREVTLSANCTATGVTPGAFTYTGFVLAFISRPFAQGAIT
jgi:hypothetical protein